MKILNKKSRAIAIFFLFVIGFQLLLPIPSLALTGGPSQPEVQSFEPVGTTDMVDLFSGDFNYNIPLLDVEGYPINISYHSGITADQEASWVGLGWNINPGVINRNMRGIPDDFKGDAIKQTFDSKIHKTWTVNGGVELELFGKEMKPKDKNQKKSLSLGINLGIKNDNYRGMGMSFGLSPTYSIAQNTSENSTTNGVTTTKGTELAKTLGLSFDFDSQDGMNTNANYSKSVKSSSVSQDECDAKDVFRSNSAGTSKSASMGFNSRSGFSGITLSKTKTSSNYVRGSKDNYNKSTSNGGSFITQNHPSYQPSAKNRVNTFALSANFKVGAEFFGGNPEFQLGGSYSWQKIQKERTVHGYGSIYNEQTPDNDFLKDFNRYNDGSYSKFTQDLPLSTITPDYFSVSGQGIAGAYKAKQSYVPLVYDDEVQSTTTNGSLNGEIGVGNLNKLGINVGLVFNLNRSGVKKLADFEAKNLNSPQLSTGLYEGSYFKYVGEKTPVNQHYYNSLYGKSVVKPSNFEGKTDKVYQAEREKRNQLFQYLTVEEIEKVPALALDYRIKNYPYNSISYLWPTGTDHPTDIYRAGHQEDQHISEVTVLADDGRKYVYGIPAMNTAQNEVTFSLSSNPTVTNAIATYTLDGSTEIDYQKNNEKINYMFNKQEMPKYAHSYLLTGILSDDFIDRTQNGITDDDYGTAVKFNYTRTSFQYHWRTPYTTNSANYQAGMLSNPNDNKGNFISGEKEIWYMHSVETKNFVAQFVISPRNDGWGVVNSNGGKSSSSVDRSYKLDSIILYSKSDLKRNGIGAVPIKTVHFVYDTINTLCQNVDNGTSGGGKLTLKKIYFTYGKSQKGKYTSYRFTYSSNNPDYNIKSYDRWGNYAPFVAGNSTTPNNAEWPFTTQNKTDADNIASAWSLNKIELPTGGIINITYESDDYAYVQDKQAQQMVKLLYIGNSEAYTSGQTEANLYNGLTNNNFLFFALPDQNQPIANYFKDIENLYFNIRSVIRNKDGQRAEEDIGGYCEIEKSDGVPECGIVSGHPELGWVRVKEVSIMDNDERKMRQIQPMAKQAFIFASQNVPEQVYPGSNPNATGESMWKGMLTSMGEITSIFRTFYKRMRDKEYCKSVVLGKSYFRVNTASKFKLGGGSRVKKIELDDQWREMRNSTNSNVLSSTYGQEYFYTTQENGVTISSGVAQWEPSVGGEENPFRQPKWEIHKKFLGRDERIMHSEPVAEALYPSASVGYSKVTVKSIGGKTGRTISDFYTAKDFPTRVYRSIIDRSTNDNPFSKAVAELVKYKIKSSLEKTMGLDINYDFLKLQQGYTIINNDMHGKMKEQNIYAEGSNIPKSTVKYKYQTITEPDPSTNATESHLDNSVFTYDYQTDEVQMKTVAVDYDISYDKQEEHSITASASGQFNIDNFLCGPALVPSLSFYLALGFQKSDFKYAVVTKQINQYGILASTEAYEDGSTIMTKSLLYDDHTGEVLLTETQNEFNDKIYNLNIPAHYSYNGMGQAYRNIDVLLKGLRLNLDGGMHSLLNSFPLDGFLTPGDEVMFSYVLSGIDTYNKAWVHKLKNGDFCLINHEGEIYKNMFVNSLRVKRSGRRNMQNLPVGGITTLKNPLKWDVVNSKWVLEINDSSVLNTSALEYSDQWQTFCQSTEKKYCEKQNDAGRGMKLWVYRMIKYRAMTQNSKYATDTISPQLFENITFCNGSIGTRYIVGTGDVQAGALHYWVSNGTDSCNITLRTDYKEPCTHNNVYRYMMLLPSDKTTYVFDGITHTVDSLEGYSHYYYEKRITSDSIAIYDSCYSIGDRDTCKPVTHVFIARYITKEIYDSINPVEGDTRNYLYKRRIVEDSLGCLPLRFDSVSTTSLFPASSDTTTFQNDGTSNRFKIQVTLSNGQKAWYYGNMEGCSVPLFEDCCDECRPAATKIINPYVEGVRGVWRKKADYAFHAKRVMTITSGNETPKIRKDGVFVNYDPYWEYNNPLKQYVKSGSSLWQKASEVMAYNPYGNEIEDKDALGVYSSALFGYNYRLPVAVAKNAKYTQIAYDGFEDYGEFGALAGCPQSHWSFEWDQYYSSTDTNYSHSGRYSLKVPSTRSEMVARKVINCTNANNGTEQDEYILNACNCIQKFSPDTGEYVVSGWLREDHNTTQALQENYSNATITIKLKKNCNDTVSPIILVFHPNGPMIEEWQRVEAKFRIPTGYALVEVYLNAPSQDSWFDDLRISPYASNMKTYAYDQVSLRLMAELDENNFATFYEYDLEGQLMRVKKETINGIVTLKEVRSNTSIKN